MVFTLVTAVEQDSYVYFDRSIRYWDWLPEVVDVFHNQPKTMSFTTSHELWNLHLVNTTKRVNKLKSGKEAGKLEGTFVLFNRYNENDVQIPMVADLTWYRKKNLRDNYISEFHKQVKKTLTRKTGQGGVGKAISLNLGSVQGADVALNISGNITIDGQLVFQDKDQVNINVTENKSWDLDVEQTQRFNIEGTIGERWSIEVKQDSEADFAWENNMFLRYKGEQNDIFQKAEAGNISLSLPSTKFVSVGSGKNEGLFGIKAEHKFGPLAIQTILSREQVQKASKSMSGGETSDGSSINDYNFIKDRYFFIDEDFKNQFYPLSPQRQHYVNPSHVVGEYSVFKKVTSMEEGVVPGGVAYLDPSNPADTYTESGSWKRLTQGQDYEIYPLLGYLRLNSISSNEAVGIAYTIAEYDPDSLIYHPTDIDTYTDVDYTFDRCLLENAECDENSMVDVDYIEGNDITGFQEQEDMRLRLVKAASSSNPNSKTWPLMFKNVYSLGASNINPDGLELEIIQDLGGGEEYTHSQQTAKSFLNIFGLDNENENNQAVDGGDGKLDLYGSLVNLKYGELFLPTHLPFAHDSNPRENNAGDIIDQFGNLEASSYYSGPVYWGSNDEALSGILNDPLQDADNDFGDGDSGPAMYFSTNQSDITSEHEFIIKANHSSRGSTMNLGFMVVDGSESVTLNGRLLEKGMDYTIDYFSGTLNFLTPEATDPTANIEVSYEENQFITFDQKLLTGTHLKYEFGEKNFLSGGAFYYKQSISDEKVDIGYEPMQNFIWNINGKIEQNLDFLTSAVDGLPFIETTKPSKFKIEGEFAEVYPNPNPLGEAFIDDFESSKRTSAPSIMQRQWKMAAPPLNSNNDTLSITDRGKFSWYNPFYDIDTREIWPDQQTSTQANNTTTKTLSLETHFQDSEVNDTLWNGISTTLYSSDYDQSQSKYMDIWLNASEVYDDSLKLHIDIGDISEDLNNNNFLDTEDEDLYGGGIGDNILTDEEDSGLDGCFDERENGFGGCLPVGFTYELPGENEINIANHIDSKDPNGDNWFYEEESNNYSGVNGLEGNGQALGYRYPDTEDMDKDYSLDIINDYFSIAIDLMDNNNNYIVTETEDGGKPTGWKLYRLPLTKFEKRGEKSVEWNEVRSMRLWIETRFDPQYSNVHNILKIAKLEMVGNQWEELGTLHVDSLYVEDFSIDSTFTIEVINTDENPEYVKPEGVNQEYDEFTGITLKEQSLSMSFMENIDCDTEIDSLCNVGGIKPNNTFAIKKTLLNLSGDKKNSFFAYQNLQMYVYGGNPSEMNSWDTDGEDADILFRLGKDDNFYELRQPIYAEWDDRNHIYINLDTLSSQKLDIHQLEYFEDTGLDSAFSTKETGCFTEVESGGIIPGSLTYTQAATAALDSLQQDSFNIFSLNDSVTVCGQDYWSEVLCNTCSETDPNGDNYYMDPADSTIININGLEGNGNWELGEILHDENENGEYDDPMDDDVYNLQNDLWTWKNTTFDLTSICQNCTELRIKGEPSINNISYVIIGVVNKTDEILTGKVLLDELRMSGVKKERGRAFRVEGALDFADLLSITSSYERKDADFHRLQERLGGGDNEESFSFTAKVNPNLFLPTKWGIKTPVNVTYNHNMDSPKFRPGSDILAGSIEDADSSIQSISEKLSVSTSFNKSARSDRWYVRSTLDNVSLSLSATGNRKSTSTIELEESLDFKTTSKYSYTFGKENYFHPFEWMKKVPVFGDFLAATRWYYTPDKLSANMSISELDKYSKQRVGTVTPTYSLKMQRDFSLNHKFTKSLSSNYTKNLSSNLDHYQENRLDFIKNWDPGVVKSIREKFTNTFSPDFLNWLSPKITYNPSYSWDLTNQNDTMSLASLNVTAPLNTSINVTPKEIIELFYTPEKKSGSSRRATSRKRGRRSTSLAKSNKIYEFKNPVMKYVLGKFHSLFSIVTKVKLTLDHSETHKFNNILAADSPDYYYRLGINSEPENLRYDSNSGNYSFTHKVEDKFSASTSLNLTSKLQISKVEYKKNRTQNDQSSSSSQISINGSESFLPLGMKGDDGLPFVNWNVNWSGFEKYWILDKYFKTITFSHSYSGEKTETFKGDDLESWNYNLSLSPLFGMTIKTKGKNYTSLNLTTSHNQSISNRNIGTPTTRNYNNRLNTSITYNHSGGLTIPLFFFRDFYLSNDMKFDLNMTLDQNYKLIDPGNATKIDEFNEDERSLSLSIKPNVTYNFTRWVNGNFYFVYNITENKTTGRTEEKDFGFKMNIRIQG